jgi:hypothetical protein
MISAGCQAFSRTYFLYFENTWSYFFSIVIISIGLGVGCYVTNHSKVRLYNVDNRIGRKAL